MLLPGRPSVGFLEQQTSGISRTLLPAMRTDIVLDHHEAGRRIVIDTKFTSILTGGWYREEVIRSGLPVPDLRVTAIAGRQREDRLLKACDRTAPASVCRTRQSTRRLLFRGTQSDSRQSIWLPPPESRRQQLLYLVESWTCIPAQGALSPAEVFTPVRICLKPDRISHV